MKTFDDLVFDTSETGWERARRQFENGYGVSVVRNDPFSYGGGSGYWELAVLDSFGNITYETSITEDVEGWLTPDKVTDLMRQVQELPDIDR